MFAKKTTFKKLFFCFVLISCLFIDDVHSSFLRQGRDNNKRNKNQDKNDIKTNYPALNLNTPASIYAPAPNYDPISNYAPISTPTSGGATAIANGRAAFTAYAQNANGLTAIADASSQTAAQANALSTQGGAVAVDTKFGISNSLALNKGDNFRDGFALAGATTYSASQAVSVDIAPIGNAFAGYDYTYSNSENGAVGVSIAK